MIINSEKKNKTAYLFSGIAVVILLLLAWGTVFSLMYAKSTLDASISISDNAKATPITFNFDGMKTLGIVSQ